MVGLDASAIWRAVGRSMRITSVLGRKISFGLNGGADSLRGLGIERVSGAGRDGGRVGFSWAVARQPMPDNRTTPVSPARRHQLVRLLDAAMCASLHPVSRSSRSPLLERDPHRLPVGDFRLAADENNFRPRQLA